MNEQKKSPKEDKPSAIWSFIMKYPTQLILTLLLIIVLLWSNINGKRIERELNALHHKEITVFKEQFGFHLGTAFALAIRSELTRGSKEGASQYMRQLLNSAKVTKIQFVSRASNEIEISTDSNDEGKVVEDDFILKASEVNSDYNEKVQKIVAPVMGVSNQLGWIVIFMNW